MKAWNRTIWAIALLAVLFALAPCAWADDDDRVRRCTVAEAKKLKDDTDVVLRGYIYERIGDDKYRFRDSTGSIVIDVDDDDDDRRWRADDAKVQVEIRGEIDRDDGRVEIEVDRVRRIRE